MLKNIKQKKQEHHMLDFQNILKVKMLQKQEDQVLLELKIYQEKKELLIK